MQLETRSLAESLALLPEVERAKTLASLTDNETRALEYDWGFWARPKQLAPPGDWAIWLLLAGRGFGKSRSGAEWVRRKVEEESCGRLALVAPTASDVRDVLVEGESGILAISPPWNRPQYEPSKRRLTWPNGAQATTYSADEPDRLRGPQHDGAWCDEVAVWRYPEAWDMLMMGLRLGDHPQCVVTTTPKPVALLRELLARVGSDVVLTRGSTYENRTNLAPTFFEQIIRRYEGTRLGQQELNAELLDEAEGALWKREWFERGRVDTAPSLRRVTVNIDPAASDTQFSDETGITATGIGEDGRGYVLADRSGRYSPDGWARAAIQLFLDLGANTLIAEKNNGGDMVLYTIQTTAQQMHREGLLTVPVVPVNLVWASKGKLARAEPVAALYEQNRIGHVGVFPQLEDQCCTWDPNSGDRSPDRLDALVWGFTELLVDNFAPVLEPISLTQQSYWRS